MSCQKQTKENILPKFERSLLCTKYKLVRNYVGINHPTAIIMTPEGYPHCIIEIIDKDLLEENLKNEVKNKVKNAKAKYAIIITDSETYWFFEESSERDFEPKQYDKIIEKIVPANIQEMSKKLISNYLKDNFIFFKYKKDEEVELYFDEQQEQVRLQNEKDERKWIDELFKFQDFSGTVYRYTTLDSVFKTLKNCNIRMNGIAGMNDISEVDYVEKFLYGSAVPLNSKINETFILSCSINKEDNLTQWRLYADDAKGVCLKFEPNKEALNKEKPNFVFRKIEYIDGENYQPIKQLKELVKYVYRITGYTFVFNTLHEWCHFIKPKDYKVESEVRLLCNKITVPEEPSGWVLADGINIINPYMYFTLDDKFPLKLTKIILGPKCPDQETNKFQLETLIKNNPKLEGIEVSTSKIKNYR